MMEQEQSGDASNLLWFAMSVRGGGGRTGVEDDASSAFNALLSNDVSPSPSLGQSANKELEAANRILLLLPMRGEELGGGGVEEEQLFNQSDVMTSEIASSNNDIGIKQAEKDTIVRPPDRVVERNMEESGYTSVSETMRASFRNELQSMSI
jgi:hypothetical protein